MLRTLIRNRRWLALVSVVCTIGAAWLILQRTSSWCQALGHYRGLYISDVKSFLFWNVLVAPVVLLLSAWCYRKLRVRWTFLNTTKGTALYFVVLTLVAFPRGTSALFGMFEERRIEESICLKSTSNGRFTESVGLSVPEYNHLKTLHPLLPLLPVGADSLRVNYYSDGFLPDFALKVQCAVQRAQLGTYPVHVARTKDGPTGWMLDTTRTDPAVAWLIYEDSES